MSDIKSQNAGEMSDHHKNIVTFLTFEIMTMFTYE